MAGTISRGPGDRTAAAGLGVRKLAGILQPRSAAGVSTAARQNLVDIRAGAAEPAQVRFFTEGKAVMAHKIAVVPGDGIGPEVTAATIRVVEATGVSVSWVHCLAGLQAVEECGDVLPQETLDKIRAAQATLKGPTTTPVGTGHQSVNVRIRKGLKLYASLRPVRSLPGVRTRYDNVDLVIVRENTEGLYAGIEQEVVPGVVETMKVFTEQACLRIAKFAFEHAASHHRHKVTAAHKATVMRMTDGLFLDCCRRIASQHPEITYEEVLVDNLAMQLTLDPTQYDLIVLENLYGDIVSDLVSGLVGGLGLVPGANIGDGCAVFEAVHGSAPDIAGRNLANPIALILSAVLMLRHIGEQRAAEQIEGAVRYVTAAGALRTADLGGTATTTEMADAVIRAVEENRANG